MRTPLYEKHLQLDAKIVDFHDWKMPLQYQGILKEHYAVRTNAGLFDVSHMGKFIIEGKNALDLIQLISTNDAATLSPGKIQYNIMCNEQGGIIDDFTIYQFNAEKFLLVVNAANIKKDLEWIQINARGTVQVRNMSDDLALLALQGPRAQTILARLTTFAIDMLRYYNFVADLVIGKEPVLVSRTGYTGEDGFELCCLNSHARDLWDLISKAGAEFGLLACGLGARDTLRLEAGMLLYGNDIYEEYTPLEAGLGRFVKLSKSVPFIGQEALMRQKNEWVKRRLVGLTMEDRKIARPHYEIQTSQGEYLGIITSGTYSPTLKRSIALGYIPSSFYQEGKQVMVNIRGELCGATITKTPFYTRRAKMQEKPTNYKLQESKPRKMAVSLPLLDTPLFIFPQEFLRKSNCKLLEISEPEVVSYFISLSRKNFGIDSGFYPLGSCTMKYNPKINDECASISGIKDVHPLSPVDTIQGELELLSNLEEYLSILTGFDRFSVQPAAGAQAEFAALLMMKSYFKSRVESQRKIVLIPDVAHGTNPASVKLVGWEIKEIKTRGGIINLKDLQAVFDETTAGIMITNPNTLGIFEREIVEVNKLVHERGGLSYLDGANFNAMIGRYKPRDQGFDLAHFNLHKTFSTPHGGGGPGGAALGVVQKLIPYLPIPTIEKYVKTGSDDVYYFDFAKPESIGKLSAFWGNFLVSVRAYAYILSLGSETHLVSETAVANAHYLKEKLCPPYEVPFENGFLHEFVISCEQIFNKTGVKAFDIAKRLMDFGFHPPTMYFPLTVKEALMVEPTETVSKEALDKFIEAMLQIWRECHESSEFVRQAPHRTPVKRINEIRAARELKLRA